MMEYDEFHAMNTTILVAAEGELKDLEPGFALVRQWMDDSEQRFSRFLPASELSALNRAAGGWFRVSEDMYLMLEEALAVHRATGGLFDPSILKALAFTGYDRSMDEIRQLDSVPMKTGRVSPSSEFNGLELNPARQSVRMPADMQLDLGGIAKGWTAARAVKLLAEFTDAGAVSAGGDMILFGVPEGAETWQVSLEDPRDINLVLAVLNVGPGALATSSVMKRRWKQEEFTRHHIIDPRTGEPSTSPWLCVTAYAPQAAWAEAFAKALLIAGPADAWQLAESQPDLRFLAVQPDGRLVGNFEPMEVTYVTDPIR